MTNPTKQKWLSLVMVISFACVTLMSCGSDENDELYENSKMIVGTWSCGDHYYGGTDYYTFNSNGKYSWKCPGSWFEPNNGNYTYKNGLLILVNSKGTSWTYLVQFSNKDTFILTDEDGYSYSYSRE